eukprot:7718711-Pyramimonas_sp.AAC.1
MEICRENVEMFKSPVATSLDKGSTGLALTSSVTATEAAAARLGSLSAPSSRAWSSGRHRDMRSAGTLARTSAAAAATSSGA